ncbi:MAG: hypothetical protein HOW59_13170 [Nonomuraea sp.]|nr:hypothetical protein [Nonomuraea sp.]
MRAAERALRKGESGSQLLEQVIGRAQLAESGVHREGVRRHDGRTQIGLE